MTRNAFFIPSGFEPQEIVNILEAKGDNKKRLDKIKGRKKEEKKLLKQAKYYNEHKLYDRIIEIHKLMRGKKIKITNKTDPIQRGYDLALKGGWDGIHRPYTPKITSVFGGHRRRTG